tara:strand:- start:3154 stop:3291 length:138 start_codon:yes stop_codon:yes gene_type:complete
MALFRDLGMPRELAAVRAGFGDYFSDRVPIGVCGDDLFRSALPNF